MKLLDKVKKLAGSLTAASLEMKLAEAKRPLRVKYGIDPTTAHVHLGHTVPLRLLRLFQEEGHTPVIILGDYTATIGDPTGRNELRSNTLTAQDALDNAKKYLNQIGKIVKVPGSIGSKFPAVNGSAEVYLNSSWLNRCDMRWMIQQLQKFTVSQILDREDFHGRLKAGTPVQMHELMYPLLQAYDSVEVRADVELGATEQMYNLNLGRDMQKLHGQEPQVCITVPILRGTDGVKKMGKSLDNYIAVDADPLDMFGKVMSIPDNLMQEWADLLTNGVDWTGTDLPMQNKLNLAFRIVEEFHNQEAALKASQEWTRQFSQRKEPTVVPVVKITLVSGNNMIGLVHALGMAPSRNEARRLIIQGAVDFNGERVNDPFLACEPKTGDRVRVGRKYADVERSE